MLYPLILPPGLYSAGTDYQSKGRFLSSDLVRWYEGSLRPIGGWRAHSTGGVMDGVGRAILTWADNDNQAWAAVGTETSLWAMSRSGALTNITPDTFSPGRRDAEAGGGYGTGLYGASTYGTPRPDSTNILPASVWTLDTFGEFLVGTMDTEAVIYEWDLTLAAAEPVANAPDAYALLVTAENILMALGAEGEPRYIRWSGIADNTDWTPTPTNQARDATLQTQGRIVLGKRVPNGNLILTDEGAFLGVYQGGPPFVYVFDRVGSGCGAVSRQCAAVTQAATYWMGLNGFHQYNGFVSALRCDVSDYVFSDINQQQISKVSAVLNSDFNEVWWFYPSGDSLEIDRYVSFNYVENTWMTGELSRTCGSGANGVFQYPLMVFDGVVYDHEVGTLHDGRTPFARTGTVEIGNGDNLIMLSRFIPDERAAGEAQVTFYTRITGPNGPEQVYGPYDCTTPQDVRLTARQVEVEYSFLPGVDGRIGNFRFEGAPGGRR